MQMKGKREARGDEVETVNSNTSEADTGGRKQYLGSQIEELVDWEQNKRFHNAVSKPKLLLDALWTKK